MGSIAVPFTGRSSNKSQNNRTGNHGVSGNSHIVSGWGNKGKTHRRTVRRLEKRQWMNEI